jgi:serine/threonine-protein kinase SRPK3
VNKVQSRNRSASSIQCTLEKSTTEYEVVRKLGYGLCSTVWLVKNKENDRHFAIKVLRGECYGHIKHVFKREILEHLRDHDAFYPRHKHVAKLVDSFECEDPNSEHKTLALPVYGESLNTFPYMFEPCVPTSTFKRLIKQLFQAPDYAHSSGVNPHGSQPAKHDSQDA